MSRSQSFFPLPNQKNVDQIYSLLFKTHIVGDATSQTVSAFFESQYSDSDYHSVKKSLLELSAVLFFIGAQDFSPDDCSVVKEKDLYVVSGVASCMLLPESGFANPDIFIGRIDKFKYRQDEDDFEIVAEMSDIENQKSYFFLQLLRICLTPDDAISFCLKEEKENVQFWREKKQALVRFLFSRDDFVQWFKTSPKENASEMCQINGEYEQFCRTAGPYAIKRCIDHFSLLLDDLCLQALPISFELYARVLAMRDQCFAAYELFIQSKFDPEAHFHFIKFAAKMHVYHQQVISWVTISEEQVGVTKWNYLLDDFKEALMILKQFALDDENARGTLQDQISLRRGRLEVIKEPECINNQSLSREMIRWFVMRDPIKNEDFSKNQPLIRQMLSEVRATSGSSAATVNEVARSFGVLATVAMHQPSTLLSWGFASVASTVRPASDTAAKEGWHRGWSSDDAGAAPFSMLPRGGLTYFLEECEAFLCEKRRTAKEMGVLLNDLFEGYCASVDDRAHHDAVLRGFLMMLAEQVMYERYLTLCLQDGFLPDTAWKNHIAVRSRIESVVDYFFEQQSQPSDFIKIINTIVDEDLQKPSGEERVMTFSLVL